MNTKERLNIAFKGLKEGWHDFEFSVSDAYFAGLEYSEFEKGNLEVKVKLNRKPQYLVLEVTIEGEVGVTCDRCLDKFFMPVEFEGNLYVKFTGEDSEGDEDLIILPPEDYEVDISHYVYESVCLSLPYQRFHPNDKKGKSTCNKEMLKQYEKHVLQQETEEIDPRWEKLKNLKNNN